MALQAKGLLRVYINCYSLRLKSSHKIKKFELNRNARFIGKLFAEDLAERKEWRRGNPTHKVFGSSKLSPKRLGVLNSYFLASITDGLTTSTRCSELTELGLLISRTELSKCGQSLKVMWSTSSSEYDEKAATILEECMNELRNNIVAKSVGGFIPQINFTQDKLATGLRDIECILNHPSVKRDLETELPKTSDGEHEEEDEDRFNVEISTNILGLKREDILKRVIVVAKRLRKSAREKIEEEAADCNEIDEEIPNRLSKVDVRSQKSAIGAFMKKQQKVEKKLFIKEIEKMNLRNKRVKDLYAMEDSDKHEAFEDNDEEEDDGCTNWEEDSDTELENNEEQPRT